MKAIEKGRQKQLGSNTESFGASPALDELVPNHSLRKVNRDSNPVLRRSSGEEAVVSEKKSAENSAVRWLQILAAVGIPLVLVYLAFAGLVNPQFAEIRELVDSNRDAIAANTSSIQRLEAKIDSSVERLDNKIDSSVERLEAKIDSSVERLDNKIDSSVERLDNKIDLIAELLILAFTNENITENELRNILNAGEG